MASTSREPSAGRSRSSPASTAALFSSSLARTSNSFTLPRASERDIVLGLLAARGRRRLVAPGLALGLAGLEILRPHPALLVLEQDLDLALGLVELGPEEAGQLDAFLEEGQGVVERGSLFLELGYDLL